ncbi:multicopper oxidase family protein [Desulfobulbus sp. AH-315-M07]|nr:multicopper oxidase family protein [Desulfobulbus sp. AH-315-M07]
MAFSFALLGCGGADGLDSADANVIQQGDWRLQMNRATDLNPDPRIVEIEIEARVDQVEVSPGVFVESWTYGGSVPGPMIEANVGDHLIVHFTNNLPEETTIHWHGVELPGKMDGTPLAQAPIEPGESFTYEFDLHTAATYWYHPHVRGNEQVERGLYAALVVRNPAEDAALGLPADDVVLLLDDLLLENGAIAAPFPSDPLKNAEMQVNGREGNMLLANGRQLPRLGVAAGEPIRLRLVNVANARFFNLNLPGHTMVRIGGDAGLASAAMEIQPVADMDGGMHGEMNMANDMDMSGGGEMGGMANDMDMSAMQPEGGLLLVPGERADVLLIPNGNAGDKLTLEWRDAPRGLHAAKYMDDGMIGFEHAHHDGKRDAQPLLELVLSSGNATELPVSPGDALRDIARIDATGAAPLPVHFGHGMPNADGDVMFFATMKDGKGIPFPQLEAADALHAKIGETRIWTVMNMTGGDHPFHPHGFFFQHLETEYIDMDNPDNNRVEVPEVLENKDTIRVPRRPGAKGRSKTIVRLAVHFDPTGRTDLEAFGKAPREGGSGGWMAHCHILEHADRGMMTFLNLTAAVPAQD